MTSGARRKYEKRVKSLLRGRWWGEHADRRSYAKHSLPDAAAHARRWAELMDLWEKLEAAGLVRLRVEPDEGVSWDDLAGDVFDVELHESTVPGGARTIRAQEKRYHESLERYGVWVVISEFRTSEDAEWSLAAALGAVEGEGIDEFLEDDYGYDLRVEAVESLKAALRRRCPVCRRPRRR